MTGSMGVFKANRKQIFPLHYWTAKFASDQSRSLWVHADNNIIVIAMSKSSV